MDTHDEILSRLDRIESALNELRQREAVREHYSVEEFSKAVQRAPFTVREWCRLGRLNAEKKGSGRGPHAGWVISHEELLRYQREGLLPERTRT